MPSRSAAEVEEWLLAYVREHCLQAGEELRADARTTVFNELGIDSARAIRIVAAMGAWLGREVEVAAVYENPTIAALARWLGQEGASREGDPRAIARARPAAIVGIGCRVFDLDGPAAFWSALSAGRCLIGRIPPARERLAQQAPWRGLNRPERCFEEGGFLPEVGGFDAAFFGISAAEACRMDPQQRFLLEVCYDALLDAGVAPGTLAGTNTGVYVGLAGSDYGAEQLQHPAEVDVFTNTGSVLSIAANRISYQLDLHGPSLTIDTACSSSAVAIHQACVDLTPGIADLAIVGGANLMLSPAPTLGMALAGVMAADARCKVFDERGDGYVRAEGAGVVILKPFDRALADGDRIYAVVVGSSTNHSGRTNGLMAPSGRMQAEALRDALRAARLKPRQVDYLEAHGTGTFIGDPIEVNALGAVLAEGVGRARKCWIGSVKSHVGHLEAAAGIMGIIKTALCIHHRRIPGQINYETPNPKIGFDRLPIEVCRESTPWPGKAGQACASVASVGFGGANCNTVLVEAGHRSLEAAHPPSSYGDGADPAPDAGPLLLLLSAHSDRALLSLAGRYLGRMEAMTEDDARECRAICRLTARGRDHFAYRLAAAGATVAELTARLRDAMEVRGRRPASERQQSGPQRRLVYVFSGQGGQWPAMGRRLWSSDPRGPFRTAFERCDEAVRRLASFSPIDCLTGCPTGPDAEGYLDRIDRLQPVLFCFQVALAELLKARGAGPAAVIGHSMGELAAAHVGGGLDLDDAVRVIVTRSRLLRGIARGGAMVVTDLTRDGAGEFIRRWAGAVSIAACNSPATTVLSGEAGAIDEICRTLNGQGAFARLIKVDVAAHSPCVDPLTRPLLEQLGGLNPKELEIPMYSTVVDRFVDGSELDAAYWVANLREPVLLVQALTAVARSQPTVFLEVSPHPVLLDALRGSLEPITSRGDAFACCRRDEDETLSVSRCLGDLYQAGVSIDVRALHDKGSGVTDWRPGHPWQHERHWWEPRSPESDAHSPARVRAGQAARWHPLLGQASTIGTVPTLHVWELDLAADAAEMLRDHRVGGEMVFPAAGMLELAAAAAARVLGGTSIRLEDVLFARLLTAKEDAARVQLILQEAPPAGEGARPWSFRLCVPSRGRIAARWEQVASGNIVVDARAPGQPVNPLSPINIDEMTSPRHEVLAVDTLYERFAGLGIHYGPIFRAIVGLWIDGGGALARLVPHPEAVLAEPPYRVIHPTILDAALQTALAALGDERVRRLSIDGLTPVPGRLRSARFYPPRRGADGPAGYWSHARLGSADGGDVLTFDVDLLDRAGAPLVEVRGLEVTPIAATRGVPRLERDPETYRMAWRPLPLPASSQRAPERPFDLWSPEVAAQGQGPLDDPGRPPTEMCMALVKLVQAIGDLDGPLAPLYVATAGARSFPGDRPVADQREMAARVAQAGLWGVARTVAAEHPMLPLRLVDFEPGTDPVDRMAWLRENVPLLGEHRELVVRNNRAYLARLEPWAPPESPERGPPVHRDAAYLVVGGAGALGSMVVDELVSAGAGAVWVAGRRAQPPSEAAAQIERARRIGCDARYVACDVARREDVEAVVHAIRAMDRPLRGIVSCAGALDDRPVASMTAESMERVMAAKGDGLWYLHRCSVDVDLDFFVAVSSAAALIGSHGQCNYAAANAVADEICQLRNAAGKTALTINWGPWSGAGLAALPGRGDRLETLGVGSFSPSEGSAIFRQLLRARARGQVVAARFDTLVLARDGTLLASSPLLSEMAATASAGSVGRPSGDRDATSSPAELEAWLIREIATVLRVPPGSVRTECSFEELGVGSLALLQLKGRIERALRVHLPASIIWKHPTVRALAARIARELSHSNSAA